MVLLHMTMMMSTCSMAAMRRCSLLLLLSVLLIAVLPSSVALSPKGEDNLGAELDTELSQRPAKSPHPHVPAPPPRRSVPPPDQSRPSAAPSRFTPRTVVRDAPAADAADQDPTAVRGKLNRGSRGQQPSQRQAGAAGARKEVPDPGMIDWIPSPPSVSAGRPWKSRTVTMDELQRGAFTEAGQSQHAAAAHKTTKPAQSAQQQRPALSVDPQLPVDENAVQEPLAPRHSDHSGHSVKPKAPSAVQKEDDEEDLDQALSSRRPGSVRATPARSHRQREQPAPPVAAEPPQQPAEPAASEPPAAPTADEDNSVKGEGAAEAEGEKDAAAGTDGPVEPVAAGVLPPSQPEPRRSRPPLAPAAEPAAAKEEPPAAPAAEEEAAVKGENAAVPEREGGASVEAPQAAEAVAAGVLPPSQPEPRRTKPSLVPAAAPAESELSPPAAAEDETDAPAAARKEAEDEGDAAAASADEAEELTPASMVAPDLVVKEPEAAAEKPVDGREEPQPAPTPQLNGRGGGGPFAAGGGSLYSAQKPVREALLETPRQTLPTPPVKGVRNMQIPPAVAADPAATVAAASTPAETDPLPAAAAEANATSSSIPQQEEEPLPQDEVQDESAPQEQADADAAATPQDLPTPSEEAQMHQPADPDAGSPPVADAASQEEAAAEAAAKDEAAVAAGKEGAAPQSANRLAADIVNQQGWEDEPERAQAGGDELAPQDAAAAGGEEVHEPVSHGLGPVGNAEPEEAAEDDEPPRRLDPPGQQRQPPFAVHKPTIVDDGTLVEDEETDAAFSSERPAAAKAVEMPAVAAAPRWRSFSAPSSVLRRLLFAGLGFGLLIACCCFLAVKGRQLLSAAYKDESPSGRSKTAAALLMLEGGGLMSGGSLSRLKDEGPDRRHKPYSELTEEQRREEKEYAERKARLALSAHGAAAAGGGGSRGMVLSKAFVPPPSVLGRLQQQQGGGGGGSASSQHAIQEAEDEPDSDLEEARGSKMIVHRAGGAVVSTADAHIATAADPLPDQDSPKEHRDKAASGWDEFNWK